MSEKNLVTGQVSCLPPAVNSGKASAQRMQTGDTRTVDSSHRDFRYWNFEENKQYLGIIFIRKAVQK